MRIVIDGRMLVGWTGYERYTRHLLEHLQQLDETNEYQVLMRRKDLDAWQSTAPNFSKVVADFEPYTWAEQVQLPPLLYRLRADLVHFTAQNHPVFYRGRHVITIHDLTQLDFKNIRRSAAAHEIKYQAFRINLRAALTSNRIIVPSQYVKDQLVKRFGAKAGNVIVIHLGADPLLAKPKPLRRFKISQPFLHYQGNVYPHKNLQRLIQAFARVRVKQPDLKLVIGGREDFMHQALRQAATKLGVAEAVVFTGYISDEELAWLYEHAELFILPSLSEGFGLPALEAMAQGTPVICANASSLPEVCGQAAAYFDPLDVEDMAEQILALLKDEQRREQLSKAGQARVKDFSWKRMAEQTLEVYRSVLPRRR